MEGRPERRRVPGEGAPASVPIAILLIGLALSGVALGQRETRGPGSEPLPERATTPARGPESEPTRSGIALGQRETRGPGSEPPHERATTAPPSSELAPPSTTVLPIAQPASDLPARSAPCRDPLVTAFDRASHALSASARREVRAFARWAAGRDGRVLVRGHADRDGSSLHNLALSDRRARSVAAVLRAHGVAEERVLVQAFGEYQPRARSAAPNRRVEIALEGVPACEPGGPS